MEKLNSFKFSGRCLCVITGGSRGFGRALALGLSEILEDSSCIALVARNELYLEETKQDILRRNGRLIVITEAEDLSKVTFQQAADILTKLRNDNESYDQAVLVHNVGSLGEISKKVDELNDFTLIQSYLDLNVCSAFTLTSAFLKEFEQLVSEPNRTLIVNVTSLAAIQPFPGWAQYCSGKAAREIYFKVLAEEFPNVTVLSYSPGPMETDMTTEILEKAVPQIQDWFKSAKMEGKLLSCKSSVKKLLHLIQSGKYKSGERMDYYDVKISSQE